MKKTIYLTVLILAGIIIYCSCSKNDTDTKETVPLASIDLDSVSFPNVMKGWELYSWPNGNDWNYSILAGTNRLKTYNEVIHGLSVTGIDSLKMLLAKMLPEANILWIGEGWLEQCWGKNYNDLALPPVSIQNQVLQYANTLNLDFSISN